MPNNSFAQKKCWGLNLLWQLLPLRHWIKHGVLRVICVIQDIFANLYFWFLLFKKFNHQLKVCHEKHLAFHYIRLILWKLWLDRFDPFIFEFADHLVLKQLSSFQCRCNVNGLCVGNSLSILTKTLGTPEGHTPTLSIHVAQADVKRNFTYS